MRSTYLLVPLLLLAGTATAQFRSSHDDAPISSVSLSAASPLARDYAFSYGLLEKNRSVDLSSGWAKPTTPDIPGKRSPYLAAGLSLILPGLGEYYVGDQIWRGMIFTGLEVGLWLERNKYLNRENDSMNAFYAYSDAHWSRVRYVARMDSLIASDTSMHIPKEDPNDIHSINRSEEILDSLSTYYSDPGIVDFTHRLSDFGSQQYYELISKYVQYSWAWDQPDEFNTAAIMRADMNNQDGYASLFLYAIIANHVLSAIDAAILAVDHNAQIHLHGDLQLRPFPGGSLGYVPTATMEVTF